MSLNIELYYAYGVTGFHYLSRIITTFDTSNIGTGAIITAILSLCGTAKANIPANAWDINIYSVAPTANNVLAASDYAIAKFGSTAYCDTTIAYAAFNAAGYNAFAFNAAGLAAINPTGISKFGARNVTYDVGNSAPSASPDGSELIMASADTAGTASDPKLVVNYVVNYVMPVLAGNFTLTGINVGLSRPIVNMICLAGSFILTGINAIFQKSLTPWRNQTKHNATFKNKRKTNN
jgi:hypothetical protein